MVKDVCHCRKIPIFYWQYNLLVWLNLDYVNVNYYFLYKHIDPKYTNQYDHWEWLSAIVKWLLCSEKNPPKLLTITSFCFYVNFSPLTYFLKYKVPCLKWSYSLCTVHIFYQRATLKNDHLHFICVSILHGSNYLVGYKFFCSGRQILWLNGTWKFVLLYCGYN